MKNNLDREQMVQELNLEITRTNNMLQEKVNELESAIYQLVEPFEDKLRDIENEHDELEWEIDEMKEAG